jgi:predicted phage-related endonuclease
MQDTVTKDREKYIGGSDIPIIMNISPFKSRFDLLLEKAELQDNDFEGNQYTEYGNVMEEKIRDYINMSINLTQGIKRFVEGQHYYIFDKNGTRGDLRLHTDGENSETILEIKTTSQTHDKLSDYKVYLVQLLFYMYFTGRPNGVLAVYERPADLDETFKAERLQLFNVELKDYKDLIDEILQSIEHFLVDLEKVKSNPFITEEELLPQDITSITKRVVQLEERLKAYKDIETQIKSEKEKLRLAMLEHKVKSWETPNHIKVTLVADTPAKTTVKQVFNEDKFKEENTDLYNSYVEDKEVKSNGRKGYVKITIPKEV